ncbi:30S ribosomal protein S4e [Methanoculleus taiwanensis]|uniref:Small ribosomal subunit protein eS4 n=1 Tax=Methanoculleus taiwanensis TaxID=1550565 RepID=A0A498GYH2_9EURY|nr:30S ribosomal protein S4e [Methanoculleus taiwanensis]RXE55761.1 30S ribosomal protein S4e [Methanoculleus taiwanensis]
MSKHLKRLVAPDSWHIPKKVKKFVSKTAPGPHNAQAMPIGVWLREHAKLANNMKEVKQILSQRAVIVNGKPVSDPKLGIGVFDIIAIPKIGRYYRIQLDMRGRLVSVEIPEEAAQARLCRIRDKTIVRGGKVQLNLNYGANVIADNTYKPKDSIVLTLGGENRFTITDHFPFAIGNTAMIIGGRHSGKIGTVVEITKTPSSVPNRVTLEDTGSNTRFDTIEEYIFMVGKSGYVPGELKLEAEE